MNADEDKIRVHLRLSVGHFVMKDKSMEQQEEKPFADVLQTILEAEQMPVHLLFRLSDLAPSDWAHFTPVWAQMSADQKRIMVRHMADLSEDNFTVDFSPIFSLGMVDENDDVRLASLDGLWDTDNVKLIPRLIEMMGKDTAVKVRAAATGALAHFVMMAEWGEINERHAVSIVDALLGAVDDAEADLLVRRAAVEALGASSHVRVPQIIRASYESDSREMQISAVFAMGNSADPRWLHIVIDEMENHDPRMREVAAQAAGVIGRSDALNELADLIEDDAFEVQLMAIHAIGQIGGEVAQELLDDVLADEDKEELHEAAEEALEEMTWTVGELDLLGFDPDDDADSEFSLN